MKMEMPVLQATWIRSAPGLKPDTTRPASWGMLAATGLLEAIAQVTRRNSTGHCR